MIKRLISIAEFLEAWVTVVFNPDKLGHASRSSVQAISLQSLTNVSVHLVKSNLLISKGNSAG